MDIAKRYEKSYHHKTNIQPITWLQATLTLAQLNDWDNVIKPRYKVIKTNNRLLKMIDLADKGIECDWVFMPLHKQNRYKTYPRTSMKNTEKLWKTNLITPTKIK